MMAIAEHSLSNSVLGVDFSQAYRAEIEGLGDLMDDGLVVCTLKEIRVTPIGVPLLRVIAMRFDATLTGEARMHSRII